MAEAVSHCEKLVLDGGSHIVATANAEMIMLAQEDRELADILINADLVVADGAGVVWAARHQGYSVPERVAGFDLVQQLLSVAAHKGHRVYMLGGAPGIVEQARTKAEDLYKGLSVVGMRDGYFTDREEETVLADIHSSRPDILLVALGVPKQEKWINRHKKELGVPLSVGVGGTFDVMAGTVSRAPVWMQQASLEWAYRLLRQPCRALRMLALPRFALRVIAGKKY
jgi:N-acetylglucosaminyldiphosphoundecaprenol N-acetyl-beta-D-mannosaminyltransferase